MAHNNLKGFISNFFYVRAKFFHLALFKVPQDFILFILTIYQELSSLSKSSEINTSTASYFVSPKRTIPVIPRLFSSTLKLNNIVSNYCNCPKQSVIMGFLRRMSLTISQQNRKTIYVIMSLWLNDDGKAVSTFKVSSSITTNYLICLLLKTKGQYSLKISLSEKSLYDLKYVLYLTHCILVDFSTVIYWTRPFVILRVSGVFCNFNSIFDGKPC